MNPVEIGTGKSFKGLAAYLLHDQGKAQTAERVAWVESHNLDDADGETAWRLMAGTAMSADKLKAAAGIKKGKPAKNVVYHLVLSFNPADQPSEAVQRAAVTSALEALGLDKHQALAVGHRDTDQTHVHVMVNLINPENGLSAASKQDGKPALLSNTQRKLSTWAAAFEREHKLAVTEGRLENATKRAQGETVDAKRKPRNVYDRQKAETPDRRRDYIKRQFDDSAAKLSEDGRAVSVKHATEWAAMKSGYQAQRDAIRDHTDKRIPEIIREVKERNRPIWSELYSRQRDEAREFERGEASIIGRIWHGAAVFRERAKDADALGGFLAAFSADERRGIITRKHQHEQTRMRDIHREEVSVAIDGAKAERAERYRQARTAYLAQCADLRNRQGHELANIKAAWRAHNETRRVALVPGARQAAPRQEAAQEQKRGRGRGIRLEPH